ncbi:MAG: metal ABC transporter substrate-binding protein [Candidatus Margulisiibacteriota bacterium]
MKCKLFLLTCILTASVSFAQLNILTSFYPVYIMALNVAGGVPGVKVESLTLPSTGCLHDYSLTPMDMVKIERSSVFIINGLGMEQFLDRVIRRYPRTPVLTLSEKTDPIIKNGRVNPHIWLSIPLAKIEVRNLADGLSHLDPSHASLYRRNANQYIHKLDVLEEEMARELAFLKGESIMTFHEAFSYFAKAFSLREAGVILREHGAIPTPKDLAVLVAMVRREKVRALFVEPQYPQGAAELITRQTGVGVAVLDPAVTGSLSKDAYIDIMRQNMMTIKRVLGSNR